MFSSKYYGIILFWIAVLGCGVVLGVVVKRVGSSPGKPGSPLRSGKPEAGRSDIVSDKAVMPSLVEASHKKGESHSIPLRSTQVDAKVGDVFGIYFQELKCIAHCGLIDQWDGTWCTTVEGNTNDIGFVKSADNSDNPIRAGPFNEGVYRKKRLVKTIYKFVDWVSK